jgi:ABC-type antimicrobial peptide transport system permease subunit
MKARGKINPPKWARRFFEWYCGPEVAEDLTGDMDELFHQNLQTMSTRKARLKYVLQIIVLIFSSGIRTRKRNFNERNTTSYHSWAMYQSYSKIAFRSLSKQKVFALINVICLSVGMSIGLLALAAFVDVLEVDNYQTHGNRIYRITTDVDDTSNKRTYASSSSPLAERLKQEATGIEEIVQIENEFYPEVIQGPTVSVPLSGYYATSNFLKVFTFPLIEGNSKNALEKPFSVVITQSASEKLFRKASPLGKMLEVKGLGNFEITGLVTDYKRSHLNFDIVASYSTLAILEQQGKIEPSLETWGPLTSHYTYLLLNGNKKPADLLPVLKRIEKEKFIKPTEGVTYGFQALTDIPMSEVSNEIGTTWGYLPLVIFFALALLVLLPACFNYTNIAIARAMKRAKEIGLRKVSGGESRHIFMQMVMETIIISVISLTGAMFIFQVIRAEFVDMIVDGSKTFDLEITPATFIVFVLFAILTGFIAGVFPATYFAKLNPIETLRNSSQSGKISKVSIRKGLIVAQFTLSMVFILGVAIIAKQYQYALNYDLGFTKENILNITLKGADEKILRTELAAIPEVSSVSMSSSIPGNWAASPVWVRVPEKHDTLEVYQMFVDQHYIRNMEMELIAGSTFPQEASAYEEYIIVNETFLEKFNLGSPHDALDKSFIVEGDKELRIRGVIKDFNYSRLQEKISSFFFRYAPDKFQIANVKLKSDDIHATLSKVETSWNKISDQKFEAYFLDDQLQQSLVSFVSMIKIFGFMGLLAITISALGLLAVVISAAETRIREMGIRKIMGATVLNLAMSLSKGFVKLIAIAVLISTPLTYLLFDQVFLRIHYYRANIGFTEIGLSILFLFFLVCLIIGSQTLKVARVNPVETLRSE